MLRVPAYLPRDVLGPLIPWAQGYVKRLAAQTGAPLTELWDEAVTALLRASIHGDRVPGSAGSTIGGRYGQTAVRRACWRYTYALRPFSTRVAHRTHVPLDDIAPHELHAIVPDPETILVALETGLASGIGSGEHTRRARAARRA